MIIHLVINTSFHNYSFLFSGLPVYHNSVVMSASMPRGTPADPRNFFTPMTNASSSKRRKWSKDAADASNTAKRSRSQSAAENLQANCTFLQLCKA